VLVDLKLSDRYDGFLFLAESRRKPPMLKSHHHAELELNLVTQGSVTYIISEHRYTFPRGSMLWIFPEQEHQLVDRTEDAGYYVAVFKPEMIERSCRAAAYAPLKQKNVEGEGVMSKLLNLETFDLLLRTMDALMVDSLDPDLLNREAGYGVESDFHYEHGDPDALNAGLHHILIQSWKAFCSAGKRADPVQLHPSIIKALSILDNESLSLSVPEIARMGGVSETYLSRLFKKQVGVPIHQYRNAARLRAFLEHYHQPVKRTILECVYAAGFGSYAQFYKVFQRHFGVGPREFLKV
jgi:AraC-like DNA-binding protein